MKTLLPVLLLLAAIALACSGTSNTQTTNTSGQTGPTPNNRLVADVLAKRTTQSAEEILSKTDTYCRKIADLKIGKALTQSEFLYLASVMVDAAEKDQKVRKRFTLDKQGRYDYEQIAAAVYLVSLSKLDK